MLIQPGLNLLDGDADVQDFAVPHLLFIRYFFVTCGESVLGYESCSAVELPTELPSMYLPEAEPQGEWPDCATALLICSM